MPFRYTRGSVEALLKDVTDMNDYTPTQVAIIGTCLELALMLIDKNKKYGDSAFNAYGTFSKYATPGEKIRIRMDDKIARLQTGHPDDDEDPIKDLLGYGILLTIVEGRSLL